MLPVITLEQIRAAAQHLANRRNDTQACSALLNGEIKAAIAPVLERYRQTIDGYAEAEAAALKTLDELLMAAPNLFIRPRSLEIDGVKAGFKKEPDALDWDSDAEVIARIKALRADLAPVLIRTSESLVIDALAQCDADLLRLLGIRTITGADRRYIVINDNDAEKLTKIVIKDAQRRQGEDEAAPKARSKAKAKVGAGETAEVAA